MEHGTINRLEGRQWQCANCGKLGSFAELNAAADCTMTQPLELAACPTCCGTGEMARWLLYGDGMLGITDCPTCNGHGRVTVAKAAAIENFNLKNT